jgi:hypothetical protein
MSAKRIEPPRKKTHETYEGVPVVLDCRAMERRELIPVAAPSSLDPKSVAQLAIFKVLSGIVMHSIDLVSFVTSERPNPREFTFCKVAFESYNFEDDAAYPNATIKSDGELAYEAEAPGYQAAIEDETCDKFAPDTQLLHVTDAVGMFRIETELAKREDQAGVHAGIVRAFSHEPLDIRPNRRVLMPEYFDQIVRLELVGVDDSVPPELAHQGRWPLVARIRAEVPVVDLVKIQPRLRHVGIHVSVSQGPDED